MMAKYQKNECEPYEDWIKEKSCLICDRQPVDKHHVFHARRNAFLIVPLCREHHSFGPVAYHTVEHEKFEEIFKIDLQNEIIKFLSSFILKILCQKKT